MSIMSSSHNTTHRHTLTNIRLNTPHQNRNLERKLASSTGDFCILTAPICLLPHLRVSAPRSHLFTVLHCSHTRTPLLFGPSLLSVRQNARLSLLLSANVRSCARLPAGQPPPPDSLCPSFRVTERESDREKKRTGGPSHFPKASGDPSLPLLWL